MHKIAPQITGIHSKFALATSLNACDNNSKIEKVCAGCEWY